MAIQAKGEDAQPAPDSQQTTSSSTTDWSKAVVDQYSRIKENAETYPYVWGSYILVYGTLGLWLTYRWRRLRNTEDRVRVLQKRLRELVEAETPAATSKADKAPQVSRKVVEAESSNAGR